MPLLPFLLRFLRGPKPALAVLLALALLSAVGTARLDEVVSGLGDASPLPKLARIAGIVDTFHSPPFIGLLLLLGLNTALCTWRRVPGAMADSRCRAFADLLMHASILVILAAGVLKGLGEVVLTKNVGEGTVTETAYDWSREREVPLGFTVEVRRVTEDYYPVRARIGVSLRESGLKLSLVQLREGRQVAVPGEDLLLTLTKYDDRLGLIGVEARDREGRRQDLVLGTTDAEAGEELFGPYLLTLVGYRRDVKSARTLISISEGAGLGRELWLGPNQPATHRGVRLFQTEWGSDMTGRPFVGIQFIRDPGAPLFWAGCIMFVCALPIFLYCRRLRGIAAGNRNAPNR